MEVAEMKNHEMTAEYEILEQVSQIEVDTKGSFIYLLVKRMFDIVCSLLAIVILSPLFLIVVVAIRLTSEGPAIYKQNRVGRNGKLFSMHKFRSMVNGADNLSAHLTPELLEHYKVNRKISNDPRITKTGNILRRTSLDELPQILDIFKGDMSVVGPRPLLPDEIDMYGRVYDAYISLKPGLTGLWQVKCRHLTSMNDRARFDYEYLQNKSMVYDLSLIFKTVGVVFSKKGAC
jgi:lipopolysaccharide/colanic/teichoic acid biosynthesis glycosyltransferase